MNQTKTNISALATCYMCLLIRSIKSSGSDVLLKSILVVVALLRTAVNHFWVSLGSEGSLCPHRAFLPWLWYQRGQGGYHT